MQGQHGAVGRPGFTSHEHIKTTTAYKPILRVIWQLTAWFFYNQSCGVRKRAMQCLGGERSHLVQMCTFSRWPEGEWDTTNLGILPKEWCGRYNRHPSPGVQYQEDEPLSMVCHGAYQRAVRCRDSALEEHMKLVCSQSQIRGSRLKTSWCQDCPQHSS